MQTGQRLEMAKERHLAGDFALARSLYETVIAEDPANADALFRLGVLGLQCGNHDDALRCIDRALAVSPQQARYHFARGQILATMQQFDAAIAAYRTLLTLDSHSADGWFALATALQSHGSYREAIAAYESAVAHEPSLTEALNNLGNCHRQLGETAQARYAYRRALAAQPSDANALTNLGSLMQADGQLEEAIDLLTQAVQAAPDSPACLLNLGVALCARRQFNEAVTLLERALQLAPQFPEAAYNLGNALHALGRREEARTQYRSAIALNPLHADAHNNLGNVLKDGGALDEGIAHYQHALAGDPGNVAAHSNLAYALTFRAEDGEVIRDECRRWSVQHETPLRQAHLPHTNERTPSRRIRIGYVSPDFRDHCQSLFTMPLLSQHDHEQFEIHCYSSVERHDELTRRAAGYADVWRDVHGLDDEQLAAMIRADRIDILVDLTMHMADGRPLLFARKPAPVQIAWLAYPGTTGIEAIDYRLTDPRLDPPGHDHQYSERSLRLPDSFWCYDPLTDSPNVNALPALTAQHVTFGCLNNPCKLSDRTLAMWSDVLREVGAAHVVLMAPAGNARQRLAERIERQGIDLQRVHVVPFQARADYLKTYHAIDLGLDTFPYNGHTTSLDSFWMGVPVVTRVGSTAVGRGGLSQLFNLGLTELAAHTDDEFVRIAVELASDLPRLAQLRQRLRPRMEQSPLMDARRFTAHVEAAYRQVWQAWCR